VFFSGGHTYSPVSATPSGEGNAITNRSCVKAEPLQRWQNSGSTLLFVDLNGKAHALWQQKSAPFTWGVPSPDSRYLAIFGQEFNGNMWIIENF